jgi:hypothetical protein
MSERETAVREQFIADAWALGRICAIRWELLSGAMLLAHSRPGWALAMMKATARRMKN